MVDTHSKINNFQKKDKFKENHHNYCSSVIFADLYLGTEYVIFVRKIVAQHV